MVYLMDDDTFDRLTSIHKRLHGRGEILTADARRDLALQLGLVRDRITVVDDEEQKLIAAAPELLAALQDAALVVNGLSTGTLPPCFKPTLEVVNAVNYAIAKATGKAS